MMDARKRTQQDANFCKAWGRWVGALICPGQPLTSVGAVNKQTDSWIWKEGVLLRGIRPHVAYKLLCIPRLPEYHHGLPVICD